MVFTRIRVTRFVQVFSISIDLYLGECSCPFACICLNTFNDKRFSTRDTTFNSKYSFKDNSTSIIEHYQSAASARKRAIKSSWLISKSPLSFPPLLPSAVSISFQEVFSALRDYHRDTT